MRIGIDLDWTIADHLDYWRKIISPKLRVVDVFSLLMRENDAKVWEYVNNTWISYAEGNHTPRLTDDKWPEVLDILMWLGYEVILVTNREPSESKPIIQWLGENGIEFSDMKFLGRYGNKSDYKFDVIVDDVLDYCLATSRNGGVGLWWVKDRIRYNLFKTIFIFDEFVKPVYNAAQVINTIMGEAIVNEKTSE